ncbi:MAG: helix-turn-helix transcriptional regulator [Cyclobacteriaceae bacterium]
MNWAFLLTAACGIAVAQGLFLGLRLMFANRQKLESEFFLGLALIGIALRIGKSLVYYFWQDMSLWGVAVGGAALWTVGPALLLFLFSQRYTKIHPLNYGHFVPAVLLLFSGNLLGWSGMHQVYFIGVLHLMVYLIIGLVLSSHWLIIKLRVVRLIFLSILLIDGGFIYQIVSDDIASYALGGVLSSVVLYLLNFLVFRGFSRENGKQSGLMTNSKNEVLSEVFQDVLTIFNQEAYYKEPKLTLNRLAEKIERPPYLVRQAIIQREGMNFNEYVNSFRIKEVQRILNENSSTYTIEGIALDVGFSSPSSFYQAFKKFVNCTPVEYKRSLSLK